MKNTFLIIAGIVMVFVIACKPKTAPVTPQVIEVSGQPIDVQKMITAKVFLKPEKVEDFIKSAAWIVDLTHKEEGCLEYTMYQDPNNKTNFLFFERYKNQAAIDTHFAATYFKEFGAKVGDWVSQPTEIKIWDISENK
jgi:quinol monooxygenase YgiN